MDDRMKEKQRERLKQVPDPEWEQALKELYAYLNWKLGGQTASGAHSELELSEPAVEHYSQEAIMKLFEGEREWQEGLSLKDQLIKTAHNLISKETEKFNRNGRRKVSLNEEMGRHNKPKTDDEDEDVEGFDVGEKSESLEVTYERARAAVRGDKELEAYVDAIEACNNFDEICTDLKIKKAQAYNLQKRLRRRLKGK